MNAILGFTEMILDELYGEVPPRHQGAAGRHPDQRQAPAPPHQRRARPLQDRGRAAWSWPCGDYSVEDVVEHRAGLAALAGRREGAGLRHRGAAGPARRPTATASGITQCLMNLAGNALKFTRRGPGGDRRRARGRGAALPGLRHRDRHRRATSSSTSSTEFRQVDATITREFGGHRARAQHHARSSSSCTAGASGSRASSARARPSTSRSRCGGAGGRHERARPSCTSRTTSSTARSCAQLLGRTSYRLLRGRRRRGGRGDRRARRCPDLILMDIQLPKMSGLDATRQLRADPRTATIPIIVITSFALSGDEQRAKDGGRRRLPGQALQPARAARDDPRVRARGLSFEKEAASCERSRQSLVGAGRCSLALRRRLAQRRQEEQFTPEFRKCAARSTPSTRPKLAAPDSVKRGQWFDVTVT